MNARVFYLTLNAEAKTSEVRLSAVCAPAKEP